MNSEIQTKILAQRAAILEKVHSDVGTLNDRMTKVVDSVSRLGHDMNAWIDDTAIKYRTAGMSIDEWYDDILEWFTNNHFMIEELTTSETPSGRQKCVMHCHLYNTGLGKHIVIKFALLR